MYSGEHSGRLGDDTHHTTVASVPAIGQPENGQRISGRPRVDFSTPNLLLGVFRGRNLVLAMAVHQSAAAVADVAPTAAAAAVVTATSSAFGGGGGRGFLLAFTRSGIDQAFRHGR